MIMINRTMELQGLKLVFVTKAEDFIKETFKIVLRDPPNPEYAYYPFVPAKKAHHSSLILMAPLMHLVMELEPLSFKRIVEGAYIYIH